MCFILTLTIWFAQRCIRLQSGRTVVKRPDPPPSAHVAPKRPPELSVSQTQRKGRSRVQARWRRRERQGRSARRPDLALFSVPPTPGPALQGPLTSCSVLCSAAAWRCPRSRGLQSGPAPPQGTCPVPRAPSVLHAQRGRPHPRQSGRLSLT